VTIAGPADTILHKKTRVAAGSITNMLCCSSSLLNLFRQVELGCRLLSVLEFDLKSAFLKLSVIMFVKMVLVPIPCSRMILNQVVVGHPVSVVVNPVLAAVVANSIRKLIKLNVMNLATMVVKVELFMVVPMLIVMVPVVMSMPIVVVVISIVLLMTMLPITLLTISILAIVLMPVVKIPVSHGFLPAAVLAATFARILCLSI